MVFGRIRETFASLQNRNLRVYFAAQLGSNICSWIQITAENWLVLQLADSGVALGITNALQFGPLVFLGLYGGLVADRFERRRLLIVTQSALALVATAIGLLVATGLIRLWMVWFAALLFGLITSLDRPALSSFLKDLVGASDLPNAVALNSAIISAGRMVGPAFGGLLIASFGSAPSFFLNAISFGGVVVVLLILDTAHLHSVAPADWKPGQLGEGLSYIRGDRVLFATVLAMSVTFIAAYNFQVVVPLLASRTLGGGSELYGFAMSLLGLGAVAGSLFIASWVKPVLAMVAACCGLLGLSYLCLALPFGVYFALGGLLLLGVSYGLFNVTVSSILQIRARDDLRGRVVATYSVGILGSALIGAPLAGATMDEFGVTSTFLIIAGICTSTSAATGWVASIQAKADH
jgi:MFS family permease